MNRFKMIVSSYLILVADGKILLLRRYQTGYENGKYSLPENTIPYIRHAIECYQKNIFYSEFGWR